MSHFQTSLPAPQSTRRINSLKSLASRSARIFPRAGLSRPFAHGDSDRDWLRLRRQPHKLYPMSESIAGCKSRLSEAERAGIKSVPALVLEGHAFHINHGADLSALKG
jgi:hypothetical protein